MITAAIVWVFGAVLVVDFMGDTWRRAPLLIATIAALWPVLVTALLVLGTIVLAIEQVADRRRAR